MFENSSDHLRSLTTPGDVINQVRLFVRKMRPSEECRWVSWIEDKIINQNAKLELFKKQKYIGLKTKYTISAIDHDPCKRLLHPGEW